MESREEAIQKEVDAEIFPVPILVKRLQNINGKLNSEFDADHHAITNSFNQLCKAIYNINDALIQYFQKQIP